MLNVAQTGRGAHVREALGLVMTALDADVAYVSVPVTPGDGDANNKVIDPKIHHELRAVVGEVAERASAAAQAALRSR